jgi:ABC-2 type transport system ATP-binding protein
MMHLAVELQHVVKRFRHHVAVDDLSLAVPAGTVYGLLGPKGAGKTTTIRMLLNIMAPDEGRLTVLGGSPSQPAILDRIGYLPEERGLYKKMRVRDVLRFLARLKGLRRDTADARIDAWLDRLELRSNGIDWGHARVDELSRGMQQKVQFIGTLLHEPQLVILDEPFSGLDPVNAQVLKDSVVELKRAGRTVLFSTHMMDNAERMCDAVCIIAGGRKVLDGSVAALKERHGTRHVELTLREAAAGPVAAVLADPTLVERLDDFGRSATLELWPGADAQHLLRQLLDAGAVVERFELAQPSLHRIFLDAVGASAVEPGVSGHG